MSQPDENSHSQRIRSLGVLFAVFRPQGDDIETALRVYAAALDDVAPAVLERACWEIVRNLEGAAFAPTPGEIRRECGRIVAAQRAEARELADRAERERISTDRLDPEAARLRLEEIAGLPPAEDAAEQNARVMERWMLRGIVAGAVPVDDRRRGR